ncbi:hypothetical protein F4861DRAFT_291753 [Xylaria intraflava]|nr:hypothetical protein F4861DRAFT_291753 [Xylaria intraflava]
MEQCYAGSPRCARRKRGGAGYRRGVWVKGVPAGLRRAGRSGGYMWRGDCWPVLCVWGQASKHGHLGSAASTQARKQTSKASRQARQCKQASAGRYNQRRRGRTKEATATEPASPQARSSCREERIMQVALPQLTRTSMALYTSPIQLWYLRGYFRQDASGKTPRNWWNHACFDLWADVVIRNSDCCVSLTQSITPLETTPPVAPNSIRDYWPYCRVSHAGRW